MNVLLNINNFSEAFAYDVLKEYINKDSHVLIIPFSYHEDWISNAKAFDQHYSRGKDEFEDIAKEFVNYGVKKRNIKVLHYYYDKGKRIEEKFKEADILFLTGGYPDRFLYRIDKMGIRDYITHFQGMVMGTSAGAMIQLDHYHLTPEEEGQDYDYHDGLGLIGGFDIEVHYEDTFNHLASLITDLKMHPVPMFILPNHGGMIVDGDDYLLLGDAFGIDDSYIEQMQEELDELIEEEIYGEFDI